MKFENEIEVLIWETGETKELSFFIAEAEKACGYGISDIMLMFESGTANIYQVAYSPVLDMLIAFAGYDVKEFRAATEHLLK